MAVNPKDVRKLMNHADEAGKLDIEHIQFGRERFPFERRFERFPFERFPFRRF
jgi:hypothetical protein